MVTAAPPPLNEFAKDWDWRDPVLVAEYPSAVFSGIVPDADHLENGGYHVSIEDLISHGNGGDYSNSRPEDTSPPVSAAGCKYSVALDMSMNPTDMAKHYKRVKAVYDNKNDPRRQYINYVNTWDGNTSHSATRFDFVGNRILTASSDHKWHAHDDWTRLDMDFNANPARTDMAIKAHRSMILGESVSQWIRSGDDMMFLAKIGSTSYLCWNVDYDVVAWEMSATQASAYAKLNLPSVGSITSLADIGAMAMGDFRDDYWNRMTESVKKALQETGLQVEMPTFEITGSAAPKPGA